MANEIPSITNEIVLEWVDFGRRGLWRLSDGTCWLYANVAESKDVFEYIMVLEPISPRDYEEAAVRMHVDATDPVCVPDWDDDDTETWDLATRELVPARLGKLTGEGLAEVWVVPRSPTIRVSRDREPYYYFPGQATD